MPYAVVLTLISEKAPTLRSINGAQLQGAFLHLIELVSTELSTALHQGGNLRPYAVTLLHPRPGRDASGPLHKVVMRVACLDDRIYPALLQVAIENPEVPPLRFGSHEFRIARLTTTPDREPSWVGYATYADLVMRSEQATSQTERITFEFATPTVFSQGERGDTPMPMPEYVFGGLARRWNTAPDIPFQIEEKEFQDQVRESVVVTYLQGETRMVDIGDHLKKTGFVGTVGYRIRLPQLVGWCHLLGETSFFSGLGAKTSRGLGCVRRI